jgi:hypothetical protein
MPLEAFLLGLSTGSYCVLSCAPLTLPLLFAEGAAPRRNAGLVGLFMGGRLVGYLAVGVVLGLTGYLAMRYVDPRAERVLATIGFGLAGAVLLVQGLGYGKRFPGLCRLVRANSPRRSALLLGLVSGLSLCPPFLTAAGRVLAGSASGGLGGMAGGLTYFLLFFLGTTPFFLPLFGVPLFARWKEGLAGVARIAMILMGAYFLVVQFLLEILPRGGFNA